MIVARDVTAGTRPAINRFELVINLETAKALNLAVPNSMQLCHLHCFNAVVLTRSDIGC
jgi:hypothetical protein